MIEERFFYFLLVDDYGPASSNKRASLVLDEVFTVEQEAIAAIHAVAVQMPGATAAVIEWSVLAGVRVIRVLGPETRRELNAFGVIIASKHCASQILRGAQIAIEIMIGRYGVRAPTSVKPSPHLKGDIRGEG